MIYDVGVLLKISMVLIVVCLSLFSENKYILSAVVLFLIGAFVINWIEERTGENSNGFIYLHVLRSAAMEGKDDFLVQRYKEKKQELMKERIQIYEMCSVVTLLCVVILTDILMTGKISDSGSLTDSIIHFMSISVSIPNLDWACIIWLNVVVSFIPAFFTWHWLLSSKSELIYYPWLQKAKKVTERENSR